MKRPVCLFALGYLLLNFLILSFYQKESKLLPFEEGEKLCFVGKVDQKSQSQDGVVLYLKDIQFQENTGESNSDTGEQPDREQKKYAGAICYMADEFSIPDNQIPEMGSYVMVEGIYKPFYKATNQGQFDQKSYYETQKIDFSITKGKVLKKTNSYNRLSEKLWILKQRWQQTYEDLCTEKEAGFLTSVVLGDKKNLDTEVKNLFSQNGIAHILAVSGVHLSILGMGLYKVLRKMGIPEWLRVTGSILLIILYGIMIHAGVATLRAIIMFGINLCGRLLGRTYDMAVATAVAACVIVTGNSMLLTSAGFVLSFMAILALLLFYPFVKKMFPLPEQISRTSWVEKIWDSFLVSFSITFFLLPVQLYYYYEIYPYAILLNLIVLPLFSFVLYLGFGGGIVGMFAPLIGGILLFPCRCIFAFYQWICEKIELLPANRIIAGKPSVGQILLFYVLVVGVICVAEYIRKQKKEISHKKSGAVTTLICCMACVLLCVRVRWNTRIVFLDVGQGDCCVIEEKSGVNLLIDAGSSDVSSCGERRLLPFLKSQGIQSIDYAFLSHPDSDHYSALLECIQSQQESGIQIKKLVLSAYGKRDDAYAELIAEAEAAGCQVLYINPGDTLTVGDGEESAFSLQCLFPYGDEQFDDTNEQSMILYGQEGDFSMLFTGDMGQTEEGAFLNSQQNCQYESLDLLKVAHHGSSSSTSDEFLQYFSPKVAVISCGVDNQYGHPHRETLERLENCGSKIFVTSQMGQITVEILKDDNTEAKFRVRGINMP